MLLLYFQSAILKSSSEEISYFFRPHCCINLYLSQNIPLSYLLFIFYLLLFCFVISRIPFFKNSGISNRWLIGLFILKIFAGVLYGLFYAQPQYYAGSDTWHFFELSKNETDWLTKDPFAFIKDIFFYGYDRPGNLFIGENSYWNDLKSNIIIKLMALCNVFTFKNYYANTILLNFLFFFGPVAFFRVIKNLVTGNNTITLITVFCIPSFLFWCSGAHKDGLIFTSLAIVTYHVYKQLKAKHFILISLIQSILFFILLFALRNFMALLLIPALVVWILCEIYYNKKTLVVSFVYFICILFFFLSPLISRQLNLPAYVVEKQNEFKQLEGNSQIKVPALTDNVVSFVSFLPTAIDIALFRPHISEVKNKSYIPAITEIWILCFIVVTSIFVKKQRELWNSGFIIFCFCFSISVLLLAGYTITFSGAIVRYRSLVLPVLIAPLISSIAVKKNISKKI